MPRRYARRGRKRKRTSFARRYFLASMAGANPVLQRKRRAIFGPNKAEIYMNPEQVLDGLTNDRSDYFAEKMTKYADARKAFRYSGRGDYTTALGALGTGIGGAAGYYLGSAGSGMPIPSALYGAAALGSVGGAVGAGLGGTIDTLQGRGMVVPVVD